MTAPLEAARAELALALGSGRIHGAYLISGPGEAPRELARWWVRALTCDAPTPDPCEACASCRRSAHREDEPALDGKGKSGPLYRHVGDHPDLLWIERGDGDTRVTIGQVRELQARLRLRGSGPGRRAAVVADAEWLNAEAQNALLRLLEEPPPRTTLVLVTRSAAGLLVTLRSRCQRIALPALPFHDPAGAEADPEERALAERIAGLAGLGLPEILDWAEEYRGPRAPAAEAVGELLGTGSAWLRARLRERIAGGADELAPELGAFESLKRCRQSLAQRNANPQMVAERALLALREAAREAAPQ